ncbi:MAG TPA: sulfite reductase [Syntrophus sp. (in: bacteria)]|nr:MAG: sulfite reductase [Syntrophus sp. GWC2_56_31]HBB16292.1 sulfite reductase [Syntrophus sp. (in: bacteria)]
MAEQSEKSHVDLNQLKAGGFIKELGKDLFSVRLRVPGGRMAVSCLKKIVEVAEKYGGEFVHLSVRQSIELVHVNFKHIGDVAEELGMVRQKVASCGARVRVPVACGGCEYNPKGLMDTQKSALEIDAKLFGTETGHHKFKVAFAGCSSDCPKSATNDVGFQGAVLPVLDKDACVGCGLCIKTCTVDAIRTGEDDKPVFAPERCIYCGDCIKICPTEAWKAGKRGYTVRIGGKWGRNPLVGTLFATFLPEEKVADFISAVLAWYRKNSEGLGRIRLGDVIIRQGTEGLLSDLRNKFPQHAVEATIPPQVIDTQIGKRP